MNDSREDWNEAIEPAPFAERANRRSGFRKQLLRYLALFSALGALSSFAGYQAARLQSSATKGGSLPTSERPLALKPASQPGDLTLDPEAISHMAPQQQAERLLELAIHNPDQTIGLIQKNLDSWRGHVEDTDQLFHLVLAALDCNDPRVRVAAVEIDLVANNLRKSPESVTKLRHQILTDPSSRSLALWRLGALGNRGVQPGTVLTLLIHYSRDKNQLTRFWAVEGLAMLGTEESIDPLLSILAHDPSKQIRERAATNLARAGMLTGEQRLDAVPQMLNLLDDDSIDSDTRDLIYAALERITGASFGRDPEAWRDWWAHHDQPEKPHHAPKNLLTT